MPILFIILLLVNFGISIWNAYAVGKSWVESKYVGGWPYYMSWAGGIQSACGFTWCYLIVLGYVACLMGKLSPEGFNVFAELGFVVLAPGIVFSGLMITVNSWARAYRQRTVPNLAIAAYNTYAQIHNTYALVRGFGPALNDVVKFFMGSGKSRRSRNDSGMIILLGIIALSAGVMTTVAIVKRVAGLNQIPARIQSQPNPAWG